MHEVEHVRRARREGDAVLADDQRRHALANARLEPAVGQQRQVAVDVGINEPRRHDQARAVEGFPRRRPGQVADGGNAVAGHAHVGADAGGAGAIDDEAVAEEEVEHGGYRGGAGVSSPRIYPGGPGPASGA